MGTFKAELGAGKDEACNVINDSMSKGIQTDESTGQLEEAITEKNELAVQLNCSTKELEEVKMKAKVEIESLQEGMKKGDVLHENAMGQLKNMNKILEAEVKIQKEYVSELRGTTLKNVQSKLMTEVVAATSNELERAGLSLSQTIESCDNRWKHKIEEIYEHHRCTVISLRESHQIEVQSLMKQNEEHMHNVQAEVERQMQLEHSKTIESLIEKEKATQQKQLRNESRKWEQVGDGKFCH